MESMKVKIINKTNKKLADELSAIFNTHCFYGYHYEKGRYINGYDGEPGFNLYDRRTGTIGFPDLELKYLFEVETNNFKSDFSVIKKDEVLNKIEELSSNNPNHKGLQYLKMKLDFLETEEKPQKRALKI